MGKSYGEQVLDEEYDLIWKRHMLKGANRHLEMDRLEALRATDYYEYCRQNGSDRYVELMRQGD